jgi:hypothetical protein
VRTGDEVVVLTTSVPVARELARLLNGEHVEPVTVEQRSLLDRYSVLHGGAHRWLVATDPLFPPSRYGTFFRAIATSEAAARRLAALLNEADPAPRQKVRRFWPF